MKIAIGKLHPALLKAGWVWYDTGSLEPWEIRAQINRYCEVYETLGYLDAVEEDHLITTDRTVIDMAVHEGSRRPSHIWHEDVFVVGRTGILIPLLDMHDGAWLCHGKLGNYYDQGSLTVPEELDTMVVALAAFPQHKVIPLEVM